LSLTAKYIYQPFNCEVTVDNPDGTTLNYFRSIILRSFDTVESLNTCFLNCHMNSLRFQVDVSQFPDNWKGLITEVLSKDGSDVCEILSRIFRDIATSDR
jgi:hypothetical protein